LPADWNVHATLGRSWFNPVECQLRNSTIMERYYRILLLVALIGIAVGIAGAVLELRMIAIAGCLAVPAAAYVVAVLIGFFRPRD
jgi:hypothetical protein